MNNRPGVRTSEFWVMAIAMVLGGIVELTGMKMNVTEAAMTFGPAMAYVVSRGIAKMGK
ncbi:hypothetical protein LCGC14_2321110 [marine sediment metagenome]|uniref:Uncharacterized protein n=1 Tax=marine sediment metagenome TaxID=412755 RepID=A0A0F9FCK6_9ZZZZ